MLLRTAKADLSDYALQLSRNADALRAELSVSFSELNMPRFPPCSNPDLWALQGRTFRSSQLKDIGRTHNGMLYCSAVLARLKKPYVEGKPTLVLADGTHVYADVPLVLASMGGDHGTVVESGDLNAVLSPNAFDHWNRPHVSYIIVAVDRKTNQVARIAGSTPSLQTSQVCDSCGEDLPRELLRPEPDLRGDLRDPGGRVGLLDNYPNRLLGDGSLCGSQPRSLGRSSLPANHRP
jgi:sensor c-di-GMP phosphodiesterase-like protein